MGPPSRIGSDRTRTILQGLATLVSKEVRNLDININPPEVTRRWDLYLLMPRSLGVPGLWQRMGGKLGTPLDGDIPKKNLPRLRGVPAMMDDST